MSDSLERAASAMGIPEALVQRSAEARAAETGASADELLAAWAGDAEPPPATEEAPAEAEAAPEEAGAEEPAEEEAEAQPEPEQPEVIIETPQPTTPAAPQEALAFATPHEPPVLVGERDNPLAMLAGIAALVVGVVLLGVVGPALPFDEPGARSSELPFSAQAEKGREVYASLGCSFCHTQMVRPVVADVGLGPVTLNDTNQVLGMTRLGPDLADVGFRLAGEQIAATVRGLGGHPPHHLSDDDLSALTAYLAESVVSDEEAAAEDEDQDDQEEQADEGQGEEAEEEGEA